MDPNEALRRIISALKSNQTDLDAVDGLLAWLDRGGFTPTAALQRAFRKASGISIDTLANALRAVRDEWAATDDVPWSTYAYGVLPPDDVIRRNFQMLTSDGTTFALSGEARHLIAVLQLFRVDPGRLLYIDDADDLLYLLHELHAAIDENDEMDDETAAEVVSEILYALHIEWT